MYVFAGEDSQFIKVSLIDGSTSPVLGIGARGSAGDGDGGLASDPAAKFDWVRASRFDALGNFYFVDRGRIRRIDALTSVLFCSCQTLL